MADSFFGFDPSISNLNERDDGGGLEASEDEYDALNDETFGGAGEDGDWEQQHEEFSLLTEDDKNHSDLEAFLSHLVLEDYEECFPEDWRAATPAPSLPAPPHTQQDNLSVRQSPQGQQAWIKNACTVEELERNIRQQPPPQLPPHNMPMMMPFYQPRFPPNMMPPPLQRPFMAPPPPHFNAMSPNKMVAPPPGIRFRPQQAGNLQAIEQQQQHFPLPLNRPAAAPNQSRINHANHMPPPLNHMGQPGHMNQQSRMGQQNHMGQPPGHMPHGHVNHHQNFSMLPNHPHLVNMQSQQKPGSNGNIRPFTGNQHNFNGLPVMKDVVADMIQMIQNTHPILGGNMNLQQRRLLAAGFKYPGGAQQAGAVPQRRQGAEGDQYSGLMSSREKQWLLNIQLLQLNTGTPYIDDYYYTVFLDRQSKKEKLVMKEAHKANQQNHPFSQQNLTNNRFGGSNGGTADGGRERRNSARSNAGDNNNKEGPRHYVPTQFENSLGKLQCGSVTAPRKIIDMEIVAEQTAEGAPVSAWRGARQTLLAIEALYCPLLRLEDLAEPLAIANALVLKEREEKQKALLLEQQQQQRELENEEQSSSPPETSNHFLRDIENVQKQPNHQRSSNSVSSVLGSSAPASQGSLPNLLDENKPDLLGKLFAGLLFEDRLNAFMNVRKGKSLVMRVLSQAVPTERWRAPLGRLWPRLLRALPAAMRRDSALLAPLPALFKQYLAGTEGWAPVSDLCLVLGEGPPAPPRPSTPAPLPRSLLHFLTATSLGLSFLIALCERASALPKPVPLAWAALVRGSAAALPSSAPPRVGPPLARATLSAHAAHAGLGQDEEAALAALLC